MREPGLAKAIRSTGSTPAEALLLGCACARTDPRVASAIPGLIENGMDWKAVLRLAAAHRLTPVLYWTLRDVKDGRVPAEVAQQLSERFQSTAHLNLLLTRELIRILDLFSAAGIDAIPYKGPALAQIAYGNLALREFTDLDLLVDEAQVLRANELLRSQGYRLDDELSGVDEKRHLKKDCEFTFVRPDRRVVFEIHWRVLPRFFGDALSYSSLAQRAISLPIGTREIRSLCPEDLLLVLCAHPIKHTWNQLNWIIDVAELVARHPGLDWQGLMRYAEKAGIRRAVSVGLTLATDLLGTTLPDEVRHWVRADRAGALLAEQLSRRLFKAVEPGALETWRIWLVARERAQDRLRLYQQLPRLILTPSTKDRAVVALPSSCSPLYYLIRPLRASLEMAQKQLKRPYRSKPEPEGTLRDSVSVRLGSSGNAQDLVDPCSPLR